jgi:hypothetical protein
MPGRVTTLRDLVIQADPDWNREKNYVTEYEVSAPGRRPSGRAGELIDESGRRVFKAYEPRRGAYADD